MGNGDFSNTREFHVSPRREESPISAPTVPRDQRTPPKILPPRPKHLRSPMVDANEEKESSNSHKKHKSDSKSRHESSYHRHDEGRSRHSSRHVSRGEAPSAPPPPSISRHRTRSQSPESSKYLDHEEFIMDRDNTELSRTSTGVSTDWAVFRGPEGGEIDVKNLKRIQIDIRRNLPDAKVNGDEPVIRDLGDPLRLSIPRRHNEGTIPLFSRDYIKPNSVIEEKPETEQKVRIHIVPLEEYERKLGNEISGSKNYEDEDMPRSKKRERSRSPRKIIKDLHKQNEEWRIEEEFDEYGDDVEEHSDGDRLDVRFRLGDKDRSPRKELKRDVRDRLGVSVKDRLGEQVRDDDYHGHGGHDNGGYKGRGYHRGSRRGRGRGRGRKSEFNLRRSDDWKYEMEEPSSTTD